MGEFLRSAYAKSLAHKHQGKLRKKLLDMHQWGVGMPGSCEALAHWRGTIEELILAGVLDPMIAVDIDLVNMFGNVEWSSIRAALQEHFPEALPWTSWQHQQPSATRLPSGTEFHTNKGAEQGDVFGSVQSTLALGEARKQHFATSDSSSSVDE